MGEDKALVTLEGRSLLHRAIDAVDRAQRVVLVGPRRASDDHRVVWTREDPPGGGPVAGIAAGLMHVSCDRVIVLAIDHPLVDGSTIDRLLDAMHDHDGAIVTDEYRIDQPLVGAYSTAALLARVAGLPTIEGPAVRALISGMDLVRVEDERAARDCDSAEDLSALERELADRSQ